MFMTNDAEVAAILFDDKRYGFVHECIVEPPGSDAYVVWYFLHRATCESVDFTKYSETLRAPTSRESHFPGDCGAVLDMYGRCMHTLMAKYGDEFTEHFMHSKSMKSIFDTYAARAPAYAGFDRDKLIDDAEPVFDKWCDNGDAI